MRGALSYAIGERERGRGKLILPDVLASQAAAVPDLQVLGATDLPSVVSFLNGETELTVPSQEGGSEATRASGLDLVDVRGQEVARRALEIAAAGGHNMISVGPPGTGKSMLASRLSTILPPMTQEESLETSAVWSVAGMLGSGESLLRERPFRAPHHTASDVGIVGGGAPPQPGELSLAHNGVLLLDELPEFRRSVLEALRQPLEQCVVVIARAKYRVTYPAKVQLVATMNPCPCGMYGERGRARCRCSPRQIQLYRNKISGPLLDRIDLHVEVPGLPLGQLEILPAGESSERVRARVLQARALQGERYSEASIGCNAELTPAGLRHHCELERSTFELLARASESLALSARGYDRVRKVARTIADLDGRERIAADDVAEAISFRGLDRGPIDGNSD